MHYMSGLAADLAVSHAGKAEDKQQTAIGVWVGPFFFFFPFSPIYTPIKIRQSLLSYILFVLTSGLSHELARTQQHEHVPIGVLVVDVEPLGGAQ